MKLIPSRGAGHTHENIATLFTECILILFVMDELISLTFNYI